MDEGDLFATPSTTIRLSEVCDLQQINRVSTYTIVRKNMHGPWCDLTLLHLVIPQENPGSKFSDGMGGDGSE
jgi:hypothetical protein